MEDRSEAIDTFDDEVVGLDVDRLLVGPGADADPGAFARLVDGLLERRGVLRDPDDGSLVVALALVQVRVGLGWRVAHDHETPHPDLAPSTVYGAVVVVIAGLIEALAE
jgi:hypothetical protein